MADERNVSFRMGSATAEFYRYWEEEVTRDALVARAKFRPERKPAAGAGMVLPPEVTVAITEIVDLLRSELGRAVLAGTVGAAGKEIGQFIWAKLRDFFSRPAATPPPDKIVIVIDRREIVISSPRMSPDPPQEFLDCWPNSDP